MCVSTCVALYVIFTFILLLSPFSLGVNHQLKEIHSTLKADIYEDFDYNSESAEYVYAYIDILSACWSLD